LNEIIIIKTRVMGLWANSDDLSLELLIELL